MVRSFGSTRFEMDTLTLSAKQVSGILKENAVAYEEFKKARLNSGLGGVVGFGGAILIAIPVVTVLAGGKPEWALAGVGGALVIASIPLDKAYRRHAQNALDEYNRNFAARIHSRLYLSATGAQRVIRF